MTTIVMPRTLSKLQELEEKSKQMKNQDFGPLQSLVNTPALTFYDVNLESRTVVFVVGR